VFFRIKQSGPRSYLQIVANQRDGGAVRQERVPEPLDFYRA